MDWQPIDTAPARQDVLVYRPEKRRGLRTIFIARYNETYQCWRTDSKADISSVTHWMSLPRPPMEYRKTENRTLGEALRDVPKSDLPVRARRLLQSNDVVLQIPLDQIDENNLPDEWPKQTKKAVLRRLK